MRTFLSLLLALLLQANVARALENKAENKIYDAVTSPAYYEDFNHEPNAFLVRMVQGMKPGKALDVGMGTGRNAVHLAKLGWDVTGFDISEMDVTMAVENARAFGTKINGIVRSAETFDFGAAKWDLVVLSYFPFRRMVDRVFESLKPGGVVMVEFFHRDSRKMRLLSDEITFADNELLQIFSKYRVLHYEDVLAKQDWGLSNGSQNRLVRLWAQKKEDPGIVGCTLADMSYPEGTEACWNRIKLFCAKTGWVNKGDRCN